MATVRPVGRLRETGYAWPRPRNRDGKREEEAATVPRSWPRHRTTSEAPVLSPNAITSDLAERSCADRSVKDAGDRRLGLRSGLPAPDRLPPRARGGAPPPPTPPSSGARPGPPLSPPP